MRTLTLLTGCAVLWSGAALAQTPAKTAELSGTWTGVLERDDGGRTNARIELEVDGRTVSGLVTGPELIPGDIVSGTFDPRTGALRFSVQLQGTDTRFEFSGAIAKDTLTVRANDDTNTYTLRTTRGAAAASEPPLVPRTPLDSSGAAVRRGFTEVSRWVMRAAVLIPPERYDYRPTQTVRTVGQLIAHVADGYAYYCGRAAGRNVEWSDAIEQGATDKATLVEKLGQAQSECDVVYAGANRIGPLVENVGHTSLHYGNLVTYIRMLGLVPPSS